MHSPTRAVSLYHNERGITAIEYALIGGAIALAVIAAATVVGVNLTGILNTVSQALAY